MLRQLMLAVLVLAGLAGIRPADPVAAQPAAGLRYTGITSSGGTVSLTVSPDATQVTAFEATRLLWWAKDLPLGGPFDLPRLGFQEQLPVSIDRAGGFTASESEVTITMAGQQTLADVITLRGAFLGPNRAAGTIDFHGGVVAWTAAAELPSAEPGATISVPAAVMLDPGVTVTFVDARQPPPPLHTEPVFVDVTNAGDAPVALSYDGSTLVAGAPEGLVVRMEGDCRQAVESGPVARCSVAGGFIRGRVHVAVWAVMPEPTSGGE